MPLNDRIAENVQDFSNWRRHLHRNPELLYEVHDTAAFVSEQLKTFGCDLVETEIGRTGVVGLIHGRSGDGGPMIGLRADMDALPIFEESGVDHASNRKGLMHACGHDGHITMLLAAAQVLCDTRNFEGTVAVVFQPAEEGGAGGKAMIDDGLFERFPMSQIYGMHNLPGLPVGRFAMCPGPIMAAVDIFKVTVRGSGGHAALPHGTVDPIVTASAIVQGLQSIVSRNLDPLGSMVVSVTEFHAGFAHNVIPDEAVFSGTVRCLRPHLREYAEKRIRALSQGIAASFGASAEVEWRSSYPPTVNDAAETTLCAEVASDVVGINQVDDAAQPLMAGEDFAYMLDEKPGAYVFVGNGDSAALHNAHYDFNDGAIVYGASYWIALAERKLSELRAT
ncbi:Peptidase, M20/M25/M40 family protein [Fulvimarina pelagi HTCC2506]|uniref:Peptidase, M20/M25/M40 family protein n=1 Tax=Fulvimarina pelagi HTCC2506 TaxID=314231 RepID=Q0G4U8_9HYPH|nr:M20 aminoacylase family protein [Fulvimarina pelagi]EAU43316.1 Peptidase, M20/M25/M40 family protein [Fulvimarina pelagi HTCC2506]